MRTQIHVLPYTRHENSHMFVDIRPFSIRFRFCLTTFSRYDRAFEILRKKIDITFPNVVPLHSYQSTRQDCRYFDSTVVYMSFHDVDWVWVEVSRWRRSRSPYFFLFFLCMKRWREIVCAMRRESVCACMHDEC